MKKFKWFFVLITACFLAVAAGTARHLVSISSEDSRKWRIEQNRIVNEVKTAKNLDLENISKSEQVVNIEYLPAAETNVSKIEEFYKQKNNLEVEIVPISKENKLTGYLRFEYQRKNHQNEVILWAELGLLTMYVLSILFLLHIRQSILKPFHTFSKLPMELAKGNLNQDIKENKSRYFGKFIWGIGMLKDTLKDQKKKELRLLKEKKLTMLSLSHDIKTPLNAIVLYTKALEEGVYTTENEKEDAVRLIRAKALEINDYVKKIIVSSTEDVVSIDVAIREFYLSEFIDKVKAGYEEKCAIHHIQFIVNPYQNVMLKGDPDRLYEAAGNLIENAFKYGDGKRIELSFDQEEYCQLIHIKNTGSLVTDQEMSHLFDSFFRGANVNEKEGNGLGLYICSEIMRKMQGDIFARKNSDGMEFILVCPIS